MCALHRMLVLLWLAVPVVDKWQYAGAECSVSQVNGDPHIVFLPTLIIVCEYMSAVCLVYT